MKTNYMTIGKLSTYSGVGVKALRYYESIGILIPSFVDDENGYRYYSYAYIPYVKIIKLCAEYGIPLKTFNNFRENKNALRLMSIINKGQDIIDSKIKQLEKDISLLEYIKGEINLSEKLHKSKFVEYNQNHEDFILVPFKHDFFSNEYYDQISKTLSLINDHNIEFLNRIGCYYEMNRGHIKQYLALKIGGHSNNKIEGVNVLHIDHIDVKIQHINLEEIKGKIHKLSQENVKSAFLLETYEEPYNFYEPHLELRIILNTL
ncbi:MerR family DNA-binding transcriptional regulator [Lactococcus garvieae]|uniref:MerR family DNA-binding transcriptional regulator n=1 Tax=Lactococcus garvieae TaxID=1363 RepID=UPI00385269B6